MFRLDEKTSQLTERQEEREELNQQTLYNDINLELQPFKYPVYRIVVLGTSKSGKTSLINSYINGYFGDSNDFVSSEHTSSYTDCRPYLKAYCEETLVQNPNVCYLQIEDTVGIDSMHWKLDDIYYDELLRNNNIEDQWKYMGEMPFNQKKSIAGFVFCFDLTADDSYFKIEKLYQEIIQKEKDRLNPESNLTPIKMIVGCKSDLVPPLILNSKQQLLSKK